MKLTFIGTGDAYTVGEGNYHSNAILESQNSRKMLIDCGSDVRFALNDLGYSYKDINDVYISHLHADHVGGLEWLALNSLFDPTCKKPHLYANPKVLDELWEHVLAGGLNRVMGDNTTIDTFFELNSARNEKSFIWEGSEFEYVFQVHIVTESSCMPCYGLFFNVGDRKIYYTSDTQFCPEKMYDHYTQANLIFHDCETVSKKTGVHATYEQLCTLDPSIKAKMWLYHYEPRNLPDAVADGFRGFAQRGQVFDLSKD